MSEDLKETNDIIPNIREFMQKNLEAACCIIFYDKLDDVDYDYFRNIIVYTIKYWDKRRPQCEENQEDVCVDWGQVFSRVGELVKNKEKQK